jgi:hypothetical protein
MNRRWPTVVAWSLLALTICASLIDAPVRISWSLIATFAASTAVACLSVRRHLQHSFTAGVVMIGVVGVCIVSLPPWLVWWPAPLLVFALQIGSRGVTQWLLAGITRDGLPILLVSSSLPGLILFASSRWQDEDRLAGADAFGWAQFAGVTLLGLLAQLTAMPWLVKTIPESQEDLRPAAALWLVLAAWLIFAPAR